jgi:hypothetical protein
MGTYVFITDGNQAAVQGPSGEILWHSDGSFVAPPPPPPPNTIDPKSGIDYAQFKDDAKLTEAQARDKLANATDYRAATKGQPQPVIGGYGFAMVGWNAPWIGWDWNFYKGPNVNGFQGFPQGHPITGGSPAG